METALVRINIGLARRARKIVRGLQEALTEDERYAVADRVVAQLKEHGDPWGLSEEACEGNGFWPGIGKKQWKMESTTPARGPVGDVNQLQRLPRLQRGQGL